MTANDRCIACGAFADTKRYDYSWCPACLRKVEFEERLAEQQGTRILDVALLDGAPAFVFAQPHDSADAVPEDLGRRREDLWLELMDANLALIQSALFRPGRCVGVSATSKSLAQRVAGLLETHKPLLWPDASSDERKFLGNIEGVVDKVRAYLAANVR
jgi:hypothetical protein